jgi:hypothetical protein
LRQGKQQIVSGVPKNRYQLRPLAEAAKGDSLLMKNAAEQRIKGVVAECATTPFRRKV